MHHLGSICQSTVCLSALGVPILRFLRQLRGEVRECHTTGRLQGGGLVNGRLPSADDAKYADRATRGDVIGWFDPEEWHHGNGLESYLVKFLVK